MGNDVDNLGKMIGLRTLPSFSIAYSDDYPHLNRNNSSSLGVVFHAFPIHNNILQQLFYYKGI